MRSIDDVRKKMLEFDKGAVIREIVSFLRNFAESSGLDRFIVGLSGGVDSSTTLGLLVRAFGKNNVLALIMPHLGITLKRDLEDAYKVAESFGVEYATLELADICSLIKQRLSPFIELDKKAYGNIIARMRMIMLYAYANSIGGVVVGTSDKSERLIGYFTKWGDAAADIFPIADLYKTQVRAIAKHLGVPEDIVHKPSSPGLWRGHLAEEELGLTYEEIDPILFATQELGIPPVELSNIEGFDPKSIDAVVKMIRSTEHKRTIYYPKVQALILGKA